MSTTADWNLVALELQDTFIARQVRRVNRNMLLVSLALAIGVAGYFIANGAEQAAAEQTTGPSLENFYSSWSGVIVVDHIYAFTKGHKANVHMVLSDHTIYSFEIACLTRFPDCTQLTVGGKFKIEKMPKDDPDLYPIMEDDYNLGSVRVTGSEQSTVYFVINQESDAARSDNAEEARHDEEGSKLRARDQLNKGVTAYKNAKYEEAIDYFQQSVALDPSLINAKMYLGTAYAQQYIPGADTPDNNQMAEQAIEQYKHVLDMNPARDQRVNAAKGIAYLYLNMRKFDEAKKYYRTAADVDPDDPEPYYSVGVIDWTACYQPRMEERAKLGLKPEENLNPKNKDQKKVCAELKEKNAPSIQEGIENLKKAIRLRSDYDDAMAYLNLMYREKADVECDDLAARAEDLKTADHWVDQTLLTKKAKAEKQPGR